MLTYFPRFKTAKLLMWRSIGSDVSSTLPSYWPSFTRSECPLCARLRNPCTFRVQPRAPLVIVSPHHTPTPRTITYTRLFYTPLLQFHLYRSFESDKLKSNHNLCPLNPQKRFPLPHFIFTRIACETRGGTHEATFPCNPGSCRLNPYSLQRRPGYCLHLAL
ncbi:hypothetical protein VNO77_09788 [Canavalia gladiata]|uniref:Uncharacterized protein n=1 Tax=Canavalia gladiata TaxID=3824 RepID=A0AAN9MG88_CANGL